MEKLDRWAAAHPNLVETLSMLWRCQVRTGIFSGFHAYVYGVRPHTSDVDLFTHPDDFKAVQIFFPDGHVVRDKRVLMRDAEGAPVRFVVDEFLTMVDGLEVQVLCPRSPVTICSAVYDLSMTDLAALHIQPVPAGDSVIGMAHLVDTIAAKALFQRSAGKSDFADIVGLAGHYNDESNEYFTGRAAEIGFTDREHKFLGRAGLYLDRIPYAAVA